MAFWKKFYKSKYTGAEIDAAVAAGSQVPEIDIEDAGKILGVDAEGKIVAKTDPVPAVTAADKGKVLGINSEGTIIATEAGNALFTDPVNFVSTIDENNHKVYMQIDMNNVGALPFREMSTEYSGLLFIPKPKARVSVSQITLQSILATGAATFSCTSYNDALGDGDKDLDLNVADYFKTGSELELNMATDMCILRCVDSNKQANSVTFGGSFLTAANPLLANKLIYVSLLIQGDGTKWTCTFNVIKYSLST